MDEAIFFVRNFGLSFDDIIAEYDATRPGMTILFTASMLNVNKYHYCFEEEYFL